MTTSLTPHEPDPIDTKRRAFLIASTAILSGIGALCAFMPFISSWLPSARARAAGGSVAVDLSRMRPGQMVTVEWRGKPVWIIRRTKAMLHALTADDARLRDPLSLVDQQPPYAKNSVRSMNPTYLILIGICTHLGCTPHYKPALHELGPDWQGGFYCPCHGSTFDLAGRVFKGAPAPINLQVPPYHFTSEHVVVIGDDNMVSL